MTTPLNPHSMLNERIMSLCPHRRKLISPGREPRELSLFPLSCAACGGAGKGEKKGGSRHSPRAEALGYLEAFYERGFLLRKKARDNSGNQENRRRKTGNQGLTPDGFPLKKHTASKPGRPE